MERAFTALPHFGQDENYAKVTRRAANGNANCRSGSWLPNMRVFTVIEV